MTFTFQCCILNITTATTEILFDLILIIILSSLSFEQQNIYWCVFRRLSD